MLLRAGDWVTVRTREEILRTLDTKGRLENLPFMPQMFRYCGSKFQVSKRAHKTCDTINGTGGRSLAGGIHLDNLRCDGQAYGGEGLTGGTNRQIPAVTKRDAVHNLFGAGGMFRGPAIAVDCWVEGGTRRINRYAIAWDNTGREYARAELAISDRFAGQGTHSLRFARKGVGGGTPSTVYFATPVRPRASIGLEFAWCMPLPLGGIGTATLYFQALFARMIGVDDAGIPLLGETVFLGEANQEVNLSAGMPAFKKISFTTTYADLSSPTDGYVPEWATHLLLAMSPIHMPSGIEIHIADLAAYSL